MERKGGKKKGGKKGGKGPQKGGKKGNDPKTSSGKKNGGDHDRYRVKELDYDASGKRKVPFLFFLHSFLKYFLYFHPSSHPFILLPLVSVRFFH